MKENNQLKIEYVYTKYINYVFKIFYFKTHNKEIAEDLTSKTFVKISNNLDKYSFEKGALSTWITKIANNTFIDYLRSTKHKNHISLDEKIESSIKSNKDTDMSVQYRNKEILYNAIQELIEADQTIIYLRYTLEYSYEEISNEMQISVNNVGIRINRLHKKIKNILEKKNLITKLD